MNMGSDQGVVKGEKFCFRNLYFYFEHGESTSTASQLTSPASQKSKFCSFYKTLDLYKLEVSLFDQFMEDHILSLDPYEHYTTYYIPNL